MPDWLKEWWPAVVLIGPLIFAALSWAVRTGLASRKDLNDALAAEAKARTDGIRALEEKVSEDLQALDRRTLTIEHDVRHLPTRHDIEGLKDQLTRAVSLGESNAKELESMNRSLTRVEDHLLKSAS